MSRNLRLFDLKKITVLSVGIFKKRRGYKLAKSWHPQNSLHHPIPFQTNIAVQFIVLIGLISAVTLTLVGPAYLFPGTFAAYAANQTLTAVNTEGVAQAISGPDGLLNEISSKTNEMISTISNPTLPMIAPPSLGIKESKSDQVENSSEEVDKSISPNFIVQTIADTLDPLIEAPKQLMFPTAISLDQEAQKEWVAQVEAKEKEEQAKNTPTPTPKLAVVTIPRVAVIKAPVRTVQAINIKVPDSTPVGDFIWPIRGGISTYFTNWHPGIDIIGPYGSAIYAANSGVVTTAGWNSYGLGNYVIISHANGFSTGYAHMSKISVSVGQSITRGSMVGAIGLTGRTTGPHLHFEMRRNGLSLNPLSFLR